MNSVCRTCHACQRSDRPDVCANRGGRLAGEHWRVVMKRGTVTKKSAPTAPVVLKLANAEDEATGDAFEIFKFTKVRGRRGVLRVPRNEAHKADKVKEL